MLDWVKKLFDKSKQPIENYIEEKSKSSFVGTFIIVFIIHRWEFIFNLLHFPLNTKIERHIILSDFIDYYFSFHFNFSWVPAPILQDFLFALLGMLIFHVFNTSSELILLINSNVIKPIIDFLSGHGFSSLDEIDELKQRIGNLNKQVITLEESEVGLRKENSRVENEIENIKKAHKRKIVEKDSIIREVSETRDYRGEELSLCQEERNKLVGSEEKLNNELLLLKASFEKLEKSPRLTHLREVNQYLQKIEAKKGFIVSDIFPGMWTLTTNILGKEEKENVQFGRSSITYSEKKQSASISALIINSATNKITFKMPLDSDLIEVQLIILNKELLIGYRADELIMFTKGLKTQQ